jgi:hypothetical protein
MTLSVQRFNVVRQLPPLKSKVQIHCLYGADCGRLGGQLALCRLRGGQAHRFRGHTMRSSWLSLTTRSCGSSAFLIRYW